MKDLNKIAENFLNVFYQLEWPKDEPFDFANLTIEESYRVQDIIASRRKDKADEIIGYKVGCTSAAIQNQFGLSEPIWARMFKPYLYHNNVDLYLKDFKKCAIEPEMVFVVKDEIKYNKLTDEELIDAIDYVSPGIELHHFHFWHNPTLIQELICTGGIHAGLVVGNTKVSPKDLSFNNEIFHVYKDSKNITSAPASEILEGPLSSLKWLIEKLEKKNLFLKKGDLVIPGSPTELVNIDENTHLKIKIDNVGEAEANFIKLH